MAWAASAAGQGVRPDTSREWQPARFQPYIPQHVDPGPQGPSNSELAALAICILIGVAGIVVSWLTRLWICSSATTDPAELARRDPWMRERLGQWNAARPDTPPERRAESATTPGECSGPPQ
jgi:hypothetical protein